MGAKPPFLEFLRKVRRTSDFGVLDIINNIFKTTQNSYFGVFAVDAKPPILEFLRMVRRPSDFGGFAAGADPPKSEELHT